MTNPLTFTFKYAVGPREILPIVLLLLLPALNLFFRHVNIWTIVPSLIMMMVGASLMVVLYANSRLRIEVGPLGVSIYSHAYHWISHLGWSQIAGIEYVSIRRPARRQSRGAIALVGPDNIAYLLCSVTPQGHAKLKPTNDKDGTNLEAALAQHGYHIAGPEPSRQIKVFLRARLQALPLTCNTIRPAASTSFGSESLHDGVNGPSTTLPIV